MSLEIRGVVFEQGTSKQSPAVLRVNEVGQVSLSIGGDDDRGALNQVASHQSSTFYDFKDLNVSPRLGNTARSIELPSGARFESRDNDLIDTAIKRFAPQRLNSFVHFLETHKLYVLVSIIFVACFMGFGVKYGIPFLSERVAHALPAETTRLISSNTLELLDEAFFEESELPPEVKTRLMTRFQPIMDQYSDLDMQVVFRKGGERIGANAFALPSGTLVFTDEIVALAEDDLELVAILGHEIGHVAHRHILRRAIQSSVLGLLLVAVTGDVSSASSIIAALPVLILELTYSREFEREADEFGLEVLLENDIDPIYFARMMRSLMESHTTEIEQTEEAEASNSEPSDEDSVNSVLQYLSTHPPSEERIRRFEDYSRSWNAQKSKL